MPEQPEPEFNPAASAGPNGAVPISAVPISAVPAPAVTKRQVSRLARLGMTLFVIGLGAVAIILVLFATGTTELPLWVNLLAMLAPVGFGVGLLGVYAEARASRVAAAARRNAAARATAGAATPTVTG